MVKRCARTFVDLDPPCFKVSSMLLEDFLFFVNWSLRKQLLYVLQMRHHTNSKKTHTACPNSTAFVTCMQSLNSVFLWKFLQLCCLKSWCKQVYRISWTWIPLVFKWIVCFESFFCFCKLVRFINSFYTCSKCGSTRTRKMAMAYAPFRSRKTHKIDAMFRKCYETRCSERTLWFSASYTYWS